MKIKNGKMIYNYKECWHCKGKKKATYNRLCPDWNKTVRKKGQTKCKHCNATNKHNHKTIGQYVDKCNTCNGTGIIKEDRYKSIDKKIWESLTFKIYKSNRKQTLNEYLYGFGMCWGTTDYGAHKNLTDKQLIDKVRNHESSIQVCHIVDKENNMPDHIGIFLSDCGYSVRAIHNKTDIVKVVMERKKSDMGLFTNGLTHPYAQIYKGV